jgi:hypothetical protein
MDVSKQRVKGKDLQKRGVAHANGDKRSAVGPALPVSSLNAWVINIRKRLEVASRLTCLTPSADPPGDLPRHRVGARGVTPPARPARPGTSLVGVSRRVLRPCPTRREKLPLRNFWAGAFGARRVTASTSEKICRIGRRRENNSQPYGCAYGRQARRASNRSVPGNLLKG